MAVSQSNFSMTESVAFVNNGSVSSSGNHTSKPQNLIFGLLAFLTRFSEFAEHFR